MFENENENSARKDQKINIEPTVLRKTPKPKKEKISGMAKMKVEKVHEDERGSIHRILSKGKEFIILFTKKGYLRGGDYHKSKQHDVVLMGKMEFRYKTNGREQTKTLGAGEMIHFEPNVPHMFNAKEDTLIVEWLEGEFEKSYYEPYRRLVLK